MFNKYIKIEITNNASYLVYRRGLIQEYAKIEDEGYHTTRLARALYDLKKNIKFAKDEMGLIRPDPKEPGAVLNLLRQKRRANARKCMDAKKPVTLHKYVGVEIEFISDSSRGDIALDLSALGLEKYVELKHDSSVEDDSGDCDGVCREDCNCADCGENHYCDDETECGRRYHNYGGDRWEVRDDCRDCTETETIEDCDCGGTNDQGERVCNGEHVICEGHCPGHYCLGYEDHPDYDCQCECTCNSGNGHEIAIVAKAKEINEVIKKVCSVLHQHSAKVNETCGLHVHIDARNCDQKRMFSNLVKSQRLLYSMVPRSRYNNSYCKPNDNGSAMNKYPGRYWGINPASYEEHKTIEVRLHSGSVNAEKICNWIELLSKIAYAKSTKEVNKLSDLTDKVKLSDKLITYIKDRVEKFASGHSSYSIEIDQNDKNQTETAQAA